MSQTVVFLVALKVFHASSTTMALLGAAPFVGMVLSLFYGASFSRTHLRKSSLAAFPMGISALGFAVGAAAPSGWIYCAGVSLGMLVVSLRIPFLSAIYDENYPKERRGKLYSTSMMLTIGASFAGSFVFGRLLDINFWYYRLIIALAAVASGVGGFVVFRIPSSAPQIKGGGNPFKNLSILWKDPLFGYMIAAWFLIGFANLWSKPLRVEYLAGEEGLGLSPMSVMVILGVLPEAARLMFTRFWARLFDKMNFIVLRIVLNTFFAVGLLFFFLSTNVYWIGFGSFLAGVGFAGGGVAWILWVTKFSPPGQSQIYMSVHTFFTGVRGCIGPYICYMFADTFSIPGVGYASAGLIFISSLMMLAVIPKGNRFG